MPLVARLELLAYLLMPFWQTIVGVTLVAAVGARHHRHRLLLDRRARGGSSPSSTCSGSGARCWAAWPPAPATGLLGYVRGILIAQVYAFYSWILWPVLIRSTLRQLTERREWAKTEREALPTGASAPRG